MLHLFSFILVQSHLLPVPLIALCVQAGFLGLGVSQLWLKEQRTAGTFCHDEAASSVGWFDHGGGRERQTWLNLCFSTCNCGLPALEGFNKLFLVREVFH